MNKKNIWTRRFSCSILVFMAICILIPLTIDLLPTLKKLIGFKYYPEKVPDRTLASVEKFSFVWERETRDGTRYLGYTQLFTPDEKNLIYVSTDSLNSLDYSTGKLLWSEGIPEDSVFHLYQNKIFSLDTYDNLVPIVTEPGLPMPSECNSYDTSILRVYDPYTGKKIWEYAYRIVDPNEIYFKDNSILLSDVTVTLFAKYISVLQVDIQSGKILAASCQQYNNHYSQISDDQGILTSSFTPMLRDQDWGQNIEFPAFVVEGRELTAVDRKNKQTLGVIEFSGAELNPNDIQLIIQNQLLVVYLDDSNQFFAFYIKPYGGTNHRH
jgi:hypothetical protein